MNDAAIFFIFWTLILVFRTLLGIGVGFTGMRNALIRGSVPEDKKSAMNACAEGRVRTAVIAFALWPFCPVQSQ